MNFWCNGGWAPKEASQILSNAMLRWQTSLAWQLSRWLNGSSDGELILAWANLGALVEGQLKLFLCVYYNDYKNDPITTKKGKVKEPDGSILEELRQFYERKLWKTGKSWSPYVKFVQSKRNAIHAFKGRDIGTFGEWLDMLPYHLTFVRHIGGGLPYPEGYIGIREI